jgi:hypothetical protein
MCTVSYKVPGHVVLDTDSGLSVATSSHIFAKQANFCGGLMHCVQFFNKSDAILLVLLAK